MPAASSGGGAAGEEERGEREAARQGPPESPRVGERRGRQLVSAEKFYLLEDLPRARARPWLGALLPLPVRCAWTMKGPEPGLPVGAGEVALSPARRR